MDTIMIKTIVDYVRMNANIRPEKIVFEDLEKSLSCKALYQSSKKIASSIVKM